MIVISIANMKGGTGKSTVATHVAAGLATRGQKVCVLDTDPQGHAATLLGLPKEDGLYNMIVDKANLTDIVRPVSPDVYTTPDKPPAGGLFLLPSSHKTHVIPFLEQDPFLFGDRLQEMGDLFGFDTVLIDTAPTASMFDSSVYLATDAFIYVTECEMLSFDGIREGLMQIKRFGKKREDRGERPNRVLGIVPNKVRLSTSNHRNNLEKLNETFPGMVWKPIAQRTIWTEASNYGQLVYAYAPTGGAADDAWTLVDEVEKVIGQWQTVSQ
jgi:chromosome partitioning protein